MGRPLFAFCGLAYPEKFYTSLQQSGMTVAHTQNFADHHPFTDIEVATLKAEAAKQKHTLVTTEKDAVRLSSPQREGITPVPLTLEGDDWLNIVSELEERLR